MSDTSPDTPTWKHKASAAGYKALCKLLNLGDIRLIAVIGRLAGYLVWACVPSRRRIVARNLRIVVDPMLRGAKLSAMVRRNIVRTSMNMACALKTGMMNDREFKRSITIVGRDFFEQAGMDGHTGISCIPHAGNWEILARIRPSFPKVEHFGSMYRRLANPLLEKLVRDARTGYGCEMFSKEDGLKGVLRLARNGGLLGVLCDQFTQEGLFLPYFGKVTGVTPLPALLYRRCKGNGKLISVFTRNTALGQWEAVMNREICLPEGCESMAAITFEINKAIERCQKENILDGLWMHHRWKANHELAPAQEEEVNAIARENFLLPFRIIVCMPERMESALHILPTLRILKHCRVDAQINIACPEAQKDFWRGQTDCVDHVVTTDGETDAGTQLEADELYRQGPYDYLFMFSDSRKTFKSFRRLLPLYISGYARSPLARHFKTRFASEPWGAPVCEAEEYLHHLNNSHKLTINTDVAFAPLQGNDHDTTCYISPFSTLGSADNWPAERWQELVTILEARGLSVTLLATPHHEQQARDLAQQLNLPCRIANWAELPELMGKHSTLYAVDGALPQIASMLGVRGSVIMASRLAQRVYRKNSLLRPVYNHVPCHPCGQQHCDAETSCTTAITAQQLIDAASKAP